LPPLPAPPTGAVPLPKLTAAPCSPVKLLSALPPPAVETETVAPKVPAPAEPAQAVSSRPKVRLILSGSEGTPAKAATPAAGPQMPSHLPDLDLPTPSESKPAARANVKDEDGPPLFPYEPAGASGVELAVAKGPEGPGRSVHAYLPAEAKPSLPALKPVPAGTPKAPARPAAKGTAREAGLLFPRGETGPARRSYTDVTAAPCFAHGNDYTWLCGQVEYSRLSQSWRLRYASVDEPDRFGGSVSLAPNAKVQTLKDGQYVRVTGHLIDRDAAGPAPAYQVDSINPVEHPNAGGPAREGGGGAAPVGSLTPPAGRPKAPTPPADVEPDAF
jgi:hypothetical protein